MVEPVETTPHSRARKPAEQAGLETGLAALLNRRACAEALWWAQVLEDFRLPEGDDENEPGAEECGLVGPDDRFLLFLEVPEPKTVKNRMHLCLRPTDRSRDEEVERVLALGATLVDDLRDGDRGWAVLADPEGNEFCVLTPYRPSAAE
ncbi:VOC family protein [Nocardioides sp. SYSU DS0663]|uniref:VOC family protein n=1 Tax=Nocardioides sp. SYSU DS0663 TaxID=3416445 RepID=UPI003F4C183F